MSRRRSRPRSSGPSIFHLSGLASVGWALGKVLASALLFLAACLSLLGWIKLTEWTGSLGLGFLLVVLGWVLLGVLIAYRHELGDRLRDGWAGEEDPSWVGFGPFGGAHYTFYDERKARRYDGSSGSEAQLGRRLAAHFDPQGGTALSGLVAPGWTFTVRLYETRDEAYRAEAAAIDQHIGRGPYLNARREGRGVGA